MKPDPNDALNHAKVLTRAYLKEACRELYTWRETGILPGDTIRGIARVLEDVDSVKSLALAVSLVESAAVEQVAGIELML